jgi:hypothetical protein
MYIDDGPFKGMINDLQRLFGLDDDDIDEYDEPSNVPSIWPGMYIYTYIYK